MVPSLTRRLIPVALILIPVSIGCDGSGATDPGNDEPRSVELAAVSVVDQIGLRGRVVADTPRVRAVNAAGSAVSGHDVVFEVVEGGGSVGDGVASVSVSTDAAGLAVVPRWQLGANAGPNRLVAGGTAGNDVVFHAHGRAGTWVLGGRAEIGLDIVQAFLQSFDGVEWRGTPAPVYAVKDYATDGQVLLAVGGQSDVESARLAVSDDAVSWETLPSPLDDGVVGSVAWHDGTWVLGGSRADGRIVIATSPDARTWTEQDHPFGPLNSSLPMSGAILDIATDGTRWVAVGGGRVSIATSEDLREWTPRYSANVLRSVATDGRTWVAGGSNGFVVSDDGVRWERVAAPLDRVNEVVWTGARWVAVGGGQSGPYVAVSDDGRGWTAGGFAWEGFISGFGVGCLAYSGAELLAVENVGLARSADGTTWSTEALPEATSGCQSALTWWAPDPPGTASGSP